MKFNFKIKAGHYFAPALIIGSYFLLVGLDLITTFYASPDLKYEGNPIIHYFGLNWNQIVVLAFVISTLLSYFFFISFKYIHSFFKRSTANLISQPLIILFKNKRIALSYLVIGCLFSHFSCSGFLIINNYLSYIYLFHIDNVLNKFALHYLLYETKLMPYFFLYVYLLLIVLSFLFTYIFINKIKNHYVKNPIR